MEYSVKVYQRRHLRNMDSLPCPVLKGNLKGRVDLVFLKVYFLQEDNDK